MPRDIPPGRRFVIPPAEARTFQVLQKAAIRRELMLVMCRRVSDNERVPVICAVNSGNAEHELVPLAEIKVHEVYEHEFYKVEK